METGTEKSSDIWKYFSSGQIDGQVTSVCTIGNFSYYVKGRHAATIKRHLTKHTVDHQNFIYNPTESKIIPLEQFMYYYHIT